MSNAYHVRGSSPAGALYRHGDVLIRQIDRLPARAQRETGVTLAHGELTGHSHRFADPSAVQLWKAGRERFITVTAASAALIHEEHRQIDLPRGTYRVWLQREYRPDAYIDVAD